MKRITLILFGLGLLSTATGCCCLSGQCGAGGGAYGSAFNTPSYQQPAEFTQSVAARPGCACY